MMETMMNTGGAFRRRTAVVMLALGALAVPAVAQDGATGGEWRSYAGDKGSTKYSPLDQIDADNFKNLRVAWSYETPDTRLMQDKQLRPPRAPVFKATPLMVGGRLFLSTGLGQVVALDAGTGRQLWQYDPEGYASGWPANVAGIQSRGVAYWTDGKDERIFLGTFDAHLVAIDAKTGRPVAGFGRNGKADLLEAIPRTSRANPVELYSGEKHQISVDSPPTVCRNVVVVGSSMSDRPPTKEWPAGDVQAFDVRTGKLAWVFHVVPRAGEFGVETWEHDSWKYSGNANVWSMMSADEERGIVYLPTSTPTSDYYGAFRPGDNLFAESLVAVDCETGRRLWHFQAVHHGVWDWDFPAAPNLVDITVDGRAIKAVAQVSKQAFTYVFDRVTGQPVWPIEERPVPPSDIPGERLSPTQPFPTKPPAFDQQGVTIDDLIDFTPELRKEAIEIVSHYRIGPMFTPPSLAQKDGTRGTIQMPSGGGGANWPGAGIDPETGILYVPSTTSPGMVVLSEPGSDITNLRYIRAGTLGPKSAHPDRPEGPRGPQGLPLLKPPYSRMTAIDLNTGAIIWQVPTGRGSAFIRNHPALQGLDLPPLGGQGRGAPLVTKTLLIHSLSSGPDLGDAGAGGGTATLAAYDKATGRLLAEVSLPGVVVGAPMTYMLRGKQYIAMTVQTNPPSLVALALPD